MSLTEARSQTSPASEAPRPARRRGTALRLVLVRLRFPLVLAAAFLVIGRWDVLRNYADTIVRAIAPGDPAPQAVSNDTEYFCPMDPGVVSDWPGKCGICNMALVRRKRGEATPLPSGVVARMQLSPYRVQLAGIRTVAADYRPLVHDVESSAFVPPGAEPKRVALEIAARDAALVRAGQTVVLTCQERPGEAFHGRVSRLDRAESSSGGALATATVEIDDAASLPTGVVVTARIQAPIAELEPFRSLPADPPQLAARERRAVYLCAEHPESLSDARGTCPVDKNPLERVALNDHQRLRWWCPMHPEVVADKPGTTCAACGGMVLRPRVITYHPRGQVLAVPEAAVVDTGTTQVVFVERMPGMFDGVEVTLGPRAGGYYPVARGLEPGQRVAAAGAFLLDAETRLNPSLAGSYFGAARVGAAGVAPGVSKPANVDVPAGLAELSADDRAEVMRQKICPVTKKPLGSMGAPVRVSIDGRSVFLCCDGCEDRLRKEPGRYLGAPKPGAGVKAGGDRP